MIRVFSMALAILTLFFMVSTNFANEALILQYQKTIPFSFGLYYDMSLKLNALKYSDEKIRAEIFIAQSGKLQLKLDFRRTYLPQDKKLAEQFIEDSSRKIHSEMHKYAIALWKVFPGLVEGDPYIEEDDYLKTFVSLDGSSIGFSDGMRFLWRTRERDDRPVTNSW